MPKKKKKSSNRAGAARSSAPSGAPTPATSDALASLHGTDEQQLSLPMLPHEATPTGSCMPERDGRSFYALMQVCSMVAVPRINAERRASGSAPLRWDDADMQANDMMTRSLVNAWILSHLDPLLAALAPAAAPGGAAAALGRDFAAKLQFLLGRSRLLRADLDAIGAWKTHIDDDFCCVGFVEDGAVFVQLPSPPRPTGELQGDGGAWVLPRGQATEERVFIVRALSTPLGELLGPPMAQCPAQYDVPGLGFWVRTTLMPWAGRITYSTTLEQARQGVAVSAKAMQERMRQAQGAYARAVARRCVYRALDDAGLTMTLDATRVVEGNGRLDWLRQQAAEKGGSVDEHAAGIMGVSGAIDENAFRVGQIYWSPNSKHASTPRWQAEIEYRVSDDRSRALADMDEGVKRTMTEDCDIADAEECMFCYSGAAWASCCKGAHAQRGRQAARKLNDGLLSYTWDPMPEEVAMELARHQATLSAREIAFVNQLPAADPRRRRLNPMARLRCSPLEMADIELKLPGAGEYEEFARRLCGSPLFFASSPVTFEYVSPGPIVIPHGIATFGQIELFPRERTVQAHALTARRATALIGELRHMCQHLRIASPKLTVQPMYQAKLNREALDSNAALFGDALADAVEVVVDEQENRNIAGGRDRCSYCDKETGDKKMQRCGGCGSKWYCNAECQKKHWKLHKPECKAAQAARMAKSKT